MNRVGWLFNWSTCRSSHCRCSGLVWSERITGWRSSVKYSFLFVSGSLFPCVCVCVGRREWERQYYSERMPNCVYSHVCHIWGSVSFTFSLFLCLSVFVCVWNDRIKRRSHPIRHSSPHTILKWKSIPLFQLNHTTPLSRPSRTFPATVTSLLALIYPQAPLIPWGIHTSVRYISWGSDVTLNLEMYYSVSIC